MSALIQIVIALTVMMPPGSYRSLQLLAGRAKSPAIEPSAAGNNDHRMTSRVGLRSNAPRLPPRARDWPKVTFTHKGQSECPIHTLVESTISHLLLSADVPTANLVEFLHAGPARRTHGSPRAVLLALHKLLT